MRYLYALVVRSSSTGSGVEIAVQLPGEGFQPRDGSLGEVLNELGDQEWKLVAATDCFMPSLREETFYLRKPQ